MSVSKNLYKALNPCFRKQCRIPSEQEDFAKAD